jgi:excisionase family DNA binding protein
MAQKYLNVSEAAKALGVSDADVKQMLDKRELYGYRDGADWKFKVEDIDRLVQERSSGDDDGYNVLASEVELGHSDPSLSGTVIGSEKNKPAAHDSDIRLADSHIHGDDDIHLAESGVNLGGSDVRLADTDIHLAESGIDLTGGKPAPAGNKAQPKTDHSSQFDELDMTLDQDLMLEDSGVAIAPPPKKPAAGDSNVDLSGKHLDDDDLVLGGGSGAGSDIAISGDSGISLVDPADSGLSLESPLHLGGGEDPLELGEDDLLSGGGMKSEDDFQLTPMDEFNDGEDSESGSQVIALDTEGEGDEAATMLGSGAGVAMLDDELGGSDGLTALPLAGGVAAMDAMAVGAPYMDSTAALPEAPYSILNIVSLVLVSLLLMLVGMMMYELLRDMWEWSGGPVNPNTAIMDTLVGLFDK